MLYSGLILCVSMCTAMKRIYSDDVGPPFTQDRLKRACYLSADDYRNPLGDTLWEVFHEWSVEPSLPRRHYIAEWAQVNIEITSEIAALMEPTGAGSLQDFFAKLASATVAEYQQLAEHLALNNRVSSIRFLLLFKVFPISYTLFLQLIRVPGSEWTAPDAVLLEHLDFPVTEPVICMLIENAIPSSIIMAVMAAAQGIQELSMSPIFMALCHKRSVPLILALLKHVRRITAFDMSIVQSYDVDDRILNDIQARRNTLRDVFRA